MNDNAVETADRASRRRARVMPVLGILFLGGQGAMLNASASGPANFKIGAWLVWLIVLLALFAFAGGMFHGRTVRALMEDESTRSNRAHGYAAGFWAAMLTGVVLYVASLFEPVGGREAIHIVLSATIAAALVTFGWLERRALRDA